MNDQTAILLHRLETGFRTDANRLKELGHDFLATLENARRMGPPQPPPQWQATWNRRWDDVERLLQRISSQLMEIEGHIESNDKDRLMGSLDMWQTVQPEETELEQALAGAREQAQELGPDSHRDWNTLDGLIHAHLDTLKATTQAMRVKLQLLKQYSREEVDQIVNGVLSRLPAHVQKDGAATEDYLKQYRQAALEIEKEQHQLGGLMDTLKAMFLWVDTPEERLRDKQEPAAARR